MDCASAHYVDVRRIVEIADQPSAGPSGGGARGAYEAGVAKSLVESESYEVIVGSSIGAVNATFIAQDRIRDLERLWHRVATNERLRFVGPVTAEASHLAEALDEMVGSRELPLNIVEPIPPDSDFFVCGLLV